MANSAAISATLLLILLYFSLPSAHSRPSPDPAPVTETSFHFLLKLEGTEKGGRAKGVSQLKQYLLRFGYLNRTAPENDTFDEALKSAIKTYQLYGGLNASGALDSQTVEHMMTPRCGVADIFRGGRSASLYSFFPSSQRWPPSKTHLTYAVLPPAGDDNGDGSANVEKLRAISAAAFAKWSAASRFTFEETADASSADVRMGFFRRAHGDGVDFDGRGGVLAHAFAPTAGLLHFDGDERWSAVEPGPSETDLESVALHEIGHLLGLGHSSVRAAAMYPSIPAGVRKVQLHEDDVAGIRALYDLGFK